VARCRALDPRKLAAHAHKAEAILDRALEQCEISLTESAGALSPGASFATSPPERVDVVVE
jgi:hypothetical protein